VVTTDLASCLFLCGTVAAGMLSLPMIQRAHHGQAARGTLELVYSGAYVAVFGGFFLFVLVPWASLVIGHDFLPLVFGAIADNSHLCIFWLGVIFASIFAVGGPWGAWIFTAVPKTIIRKIYHAVAIAIFLPGALLAPGFMRLASAGTMAMFGMLEFFRASKVAVIGDVLEGFISKHLDAQDQGVIVLTHIYLLLGLAAPVWLAAPSLAGTETVARSLAPLAGCLVVGVGDAVASIVGRLKGKRKWKGSPKSVEGTLAAFIVTLLCAIALKFALGTPEPVFALAFTTLMACLLEAFTIQIDNLFLPIWYFILLNICSFST